MAAQVSNECCVVIIYKVRGNVLALRCRDLDLVTAYIDLVVEYIEDNAAGNLANDITYERPNFSDGFNL